MVDSMIIDTDRCRERELTTACDGIFVEKQRNPLGLSVGLYPQQQYTEQHPVVLPGELRPGDTVPVSHGRNDSHSLSQSRHHPLQQDRFCGQWEGMDISVGVVYVCVNLTLGVDFEVAKLESVWERDVCRKQDAEVFSFHAMDFISKLKLFYSLFNLRRHMFATVTHACSDI